jgi:CRISPR system Cascade subunit CasB
MTALKKEKQATPDFVAIYTRFIQLKEQISGLEAEIKRATEPEDLLEIPSFYRLMVATPLGTNKTSQRIAFFLPFVSHAENAVSLGKQLADNNVSEMRLFQVLRSEEPNDLVQLRRLIQQIKPSLNWQEFGTMLNYWSKQQKRRLLEDYFLHQNH